jgi:hypothetical protein
VIPAVRVGYTLEAPTWVDVDMQVQMQLPGAADWVAARVTCAMGDMARVEAVVGGKLHQVVRGLSELRVRVQQPA